MANNFENLYNGLNLRPLASDPTNPKDGDIFYSDGTSRTKGLWQFKDGVWSTIGGGAGGSLDTFVQLTAEEQLSEWSNGNNATFLGGGVLAGTFAKESSSPLNGLESYKFTQAAGSLNDYLASDVQEVPVRFRGNQVTAFFPYLYDGNNADIDFIIYDVTNTTVLTVDAELAATGNNTSIYKVNVAIPITCTQIRVGFHVKVLNSGKILQFDDVQVSADTTQFADTGLVTDWQSYTPTFTGFGTVSVQTFQWRRIGDSIQINGRFTLGTTTATEARISLPLNHVSSSSYTTLHAVGIGAINATNQSIKALIEPSIGYITLGVMNSTTADLAKINGNGFASGGIMSVDATVKISGLTASNPQIITASESFSTDTASLVYASSATYTLATLADAPVGTFITFTYAASTNTRTQTTTAPTQTTSDMNVNGIKVFTRVIGASSTAGDPACIAIQIGKGLKGTSARIYKSMGKTTAGSLDFWSDIDGTIKQGASINSYNETSGIAVIDLAYDRTGGSTTSEILYEDISTQNNGYLVINASKSPALVGVPQVQPRFALLSDVKADTTDGGTFTSGAWQTRTLNTSVDSGGLGVTLAANQFVLTAGEYNLDFAAEAFAVDQHQTRIRNITAGTTSLLGRRSNANSASGTGSVSRGRGNIIITTTTTFELQHRCGTTKATNGFGSGTSSFGESVVFASVSIEKVK